jgi:hypothetical protein
MYIISGDNWSGRDLNVQEPLRHLKEKNLECVFYPGTFGEDKAWMSNNSGDIQVSKGTIENIHTFFDCRLSLSLSLENLDTRLLFCCVVDAAVLPESTMFDL